MPSLTLTLHFVLILSVIGTDPEDLDQCCSHGRQRSSEPGGSGCGGIPRPSVAGITDEAEKLCLVTQKMCCLKEQKEAACLKGKQQAQEEKDCGLTSNLIPVDGVTMVVMLF